MRTPFTIQTVALLALSLSRGAPAEIQEEFLSNRPRLVRVTVQDVDSTERWKMSDVDLVNSLGDTVRGRIRIPRSPGASRHPLAFLVVGLETGREVVHLIRGHDSVIVFGMDYPNLDELDFSGWNIVGTTLRLREAAFATIPNIALCLDWLCSLPYVDTGDIAMVAVSFGVFTAVPAAACDLRVDRLAVVQAGGDLAAVISANAGRLGFPIPGWFAGWLGEAVLAPFEPNDYIGLVAPRPFLLVSGESDRFFPQSSVRSLYDHACEPKQWIRHSSEHVLPTERALIVELTDIVALHLYGAR